MKIIIKGRGLSLTPSLKNYVEKKIEKTEKHLPKQTREVAKAEAWLVYFHRHKKGQNSHCHITLYLPLKMLRVQESSEEMHAAVDLAVEKLENQILKYKQRFDPSKNQRRFLKQKEIFKSLLEKIFRR